MLYLLSYLFELTFNMFIVYILYQAKRLKEQEEMLARERWELAGIEEQRRAQEKEHAKVEFRYRVQTSSVPVKYYCSGEMVHFFGFSFFFITTV